ncbi:hypothetical protein P3F61_001798, partial [Campylobacter jejuni]|nr:hypothetical protein [Campylobacter jejuni]
TVIYSNIGIEGRCKNVLKNLDFLDTPDYVDRGKIWTNDAKYLNSYIAKVLNTSKNDGKNSFLNKKQLSVLEGWLAAFGNE